MVLVVQMITGGKNTSLVMFKTFESLSRVSSEIQYELGILPTTAG